MKNIVYQSSIYAKGDIHIGDIYQIDDHTQEIPLELNTLPFIEHNDVIGRDSDLINVHDILAKKDKLVLVNGIGGIGKTTLAKLFLAEYRTNYNYVAWVDNMTDTKEAFIHNIALLDSLHLRTEIEQLPKDERWIDDAFALIINRMRQLGGNQSTKKNLLIIDNATEDIEHTKVIDQISLRPNWKVLITSREKLIGFEEYELGFLSPAMAKKLFYLHYSYEQNDILLEEILQTIDYHTLLIETISKTAQSLRLSLSEILNRLKKKGLNISEKAKIKFPHNYNQRIFNIFEYLLEVFNIAQLNDTDHWILKQFSVLPSFFLPYNPDKKESILNLLQIQQQEKKDNITLGINRLVEKGWLQWDSKADTFKMHHIIQEVLRFKLKPNTLDCQDLIQEMYARISYQNIDFISKNNTIVKHLKEYINGESIDFAELIDEYASVVQRLYDYPTSIQLQQRALDMKFQLLSNTDSKLADSYNSLALSYLSLGDLEQALEYQLKDLEITKLNSKEENYDLAITYNNLSLIYRKLEAFDTAIEYQEKAANIADKIQDADLNNVVSNNLGNLAYLQKNFSTALKHFQTSLKIRQQNTADSLWISEAHYNLGTTYIEVSAFQKAKKHLDLAYDTEKELVPDKSSFAGILHGYGLLYFELKDYEKALNYFKDSLKIYLLNFDENHKDVLKTKKWVSDVQQKLRING